MTFRENIEFCNIRSRGGMRGKGGGKSDNCGFSKNEKFIALLCWKDEAGSQYITKPIQTGWEN